MKLRLYSAEGANCCERIRWMLDYKSVSFELMDIESSEAVSAFRLHSPFGRVPVLLVDGEPLTESMAIAEFIEEIAPVPNLLGTSIGLRARVREVCEVVNSSIHPVQNSSVVRYFHPTWSKDAMRTVRANWIEHNLLKLRPLLWSSSSYVVGDGFTLADIFVAIIFRKAMALGASAEVLSDFERHWSFLMSMPDVRASYPHAIVAN